MDTPIEKKRKLLDTHKNKIINRSFDKALAKHRQTERKDKGYYFENRQEDVKEMIEQGLVVRTFSFKKIGDAEEMFLFLVRFWFCRQKPHQPMNFI